MMAATGAIFPGESGIWSLCSCVSGSRSNSLVPGVQPGTMTDSPSLSAQQLAEALHNGLNVDTIWFNQSPHHHGGFQWKSFDLSTFKLLILATPSLTDARYDPLRFQLHEHFIRMEKDTELLKIFLLAGNDLPRVYYNQVMEWVHHCPRTTRIQKWVVHYNMHLVKPLLHQARRAVRAAIRHNTVTGVTSLPVPVAMKGFINLSDACHELPYNNVPAAVTSRAALQ